MVLTPGTKIGPYEIVGPLGSGGMGEVFRARDARLGRDAAIKALPAAFAHDSERLARFEREARLLASLSHPNIAGIHGLEEAGGARYLALELVEGETLASRLARGRMPLDEALDVAKQIAAGVEAAHENDVVHRDLKPGNVMLTPAGAVKVLDFGLARSGAGDRAGADPGLSASPTMSYMGTQAGVILGTAAYMSPEQARGKAVDKRSDIWSFGCVLFECLTGRQAFAGETVSDIVARILQTEPEWDTLPKDTPERLRTLLERCLEKDAKRRLRDLGEARIELEDLVAARSTKSGAVRLAKSPRAAAGPVPWLAVAATAVVVAAATWFLPRLLARPTPPTPARFEIAAPPGRILPSDASRIALSPDGTRLALVVVDSAGTSTLWVRRMDSLEPKALPGTEGAYLPFWSPDSRWIGFFVGDDALMKIAVDGTGLERICATTAARGGAWGPDGTILFAPYSNGGIFRVSARGGTPVQVTRPDSAKGVTGHRFPQFLPDGKRFLFVGVPAGADGNGGLHLGSVDGGPTREIGRVEAGVAWVAPGWLVTTRNRSLVAWRVDPSSPKLEGEPVVVGDALESTTFVGCPLATASRDGALAFLTRRDVPRRATWYDLATGHEIADAPVPPGRYANAVLAPDDRRALFSVQVEARRADLVLVDLERGVTTRLSDGSEDAEIGRMSPDQAHVAYVDLNTQTIRVRSLADGSLRTFLADDRSYKNVYGFTPDGRGLVYSRLDPATRWDLWYLPLDGGAPQPLRVTPANEVEAGLSPDGRWLQFTTDESGTGELCVIPFMAPGLKYQVTVGGGGGEFSRDGRQLRFIETRDPGVMQVADILPGPRFALGPPRVHFRLPPDFFASPFDIAGDGRRALRLLSAEKPVPQAATILQNWTGAIRSH